MIIKYEFADGSKSEVEVSDEIGAVIIADRRDEHALEERNRYHCYSLDAAVYEGEDYADPDTPETAYITAYISKSLQTALAELTDTQRRRFLLYASGLSFREIGRREGVDHKKVAKSIEAARNKMKKYFEFFQKQGPQKHPKICVYRRE